MIIDEMKARLCEVMRQISALNKERIDLQNGIAELNSPFRVGDLVEFDAGRGRSKGIVLKIVPWVGSSGTLIVSVIRKDGSQGRERNVHPYMKPMKATS